MPRTRCRSRSTLCCWSTSPATPPNRSIQATAGTNCPNDAARFAAYERAGGSRGGQHRVELRLDATARDVRAIRCGQTALIFDTERRALEFVPYRIRVNTVSRARYWSRVTVGDRHRLANPE